MTLCMRALFVLGFAVTLPADAACHGGAIPIAAARPPPRLRAAIYRGRPGGGFAGACRRRRLLRAASSPRSRSPISASSTVCVSPIWADAAIFSCRLPEGDGLAVSDLVLAIDDVSAHDARRNLEVQVNDRTATAIALDGNSHGRTIRVPLGKTKPKDGYLKLSFLYSGAATIDRCIDVRAVGDTLTIDPETGVDVYVGQAAILGVATTAALMPRDVAIILPDPARRGK